MLSRTQQALYHVGCSIRHLWKAFCAGWALVVVALAVSLAFWLSGCNSSPNPPTPTPPAATTAAAVSAMTGAEATTRADVAANVETARKANGTQPDSPAKATVEGELSLASTRLNTTPSPAEILAGEQRARALADGRTEEARKLYAQANTQATEEAKARAKAEADLQAALLKQAQDAERYQKALDDLKTENAKQLEAARSEVMRDQVKWLNRVAAACAALAVGAVGLCIAFGGLAALRIAGPFAALCGFASFACFGLAQIVGAWWFKWAALCGCAIVAGAAAAWVWKHYKQGDLKAQAEAKASSYGTALKQIVPVLDDAYEHAEASTREALDKLIFSRLSSVMNAEDKATIHTIRAAK